MFLKRCSIWGIKSRDRNGGLNSGVDYFAAFLHLITLDPDGLDFALSIPFPVLSVNLIWSFDGLVPPWWCPWDWTMAHPCGYNLLCCKKVSWKWLGHFFALVTRIPPWNHRKWPKVEAMVKPNGVWYYLELNNILLLVLRQLPYLK